MKIFVWLLFIGLLLGLTLGPVWGQPHHQEGGVAQGHASSGELQEVASDIPVDDLDRGTPRRAVEGFLRAASAHDYRRAARYLDLRRFPVGEAELRGPQLARHLKIVLDQKLPIDVDSLSDKPTHLHPRNNTAGVRGRLVRMSQGLVQSSSQQASKVKAFPRKSLDGEAVGWG